MYKTLSAILALITAATLAQAGIKGVNVDRVVRYWYSTTHSIDVPAERDHLWLQLDNGNGIEIKWKDEAHAQPSEAWIIANADAADAWYAAEQVKAGTSGHAFVQFRTKLTASGYDTSGLNSKADLIGTLPSIISHIQALIDAKDVEINAHLSANEYKQAIQKMQARNQLTDGYNQIQSWALAMMLRSAAGK